MISIHFQGKPFNNTIIQVYAQATNVQEAEVERFYEDLQDLLKLTPKEMSFEFHRGLECKSRTSRDTWNNRQVWPWSTKWNGTKTNSFAKRTHWLLQTPSSGNTREDSTHGHHPMVNTKIRLITFFAEKLYTFRKNKTVSWLWLRSWTSYCKIQTLVEENSVNH